MQPATSLLRDLVRKRDFYAGGLMLLLGLGVALKGSTYRAGTLATLAGGALVASALLRTTEGKLAFRMDTPGGRYCEGLDLARSYEVLGRHAPQAIRGYRTEAELRSLVGTGVSAAALWTLRLVLNEAGFPNARIVASSGFGPEKCRMMAAANAPIDTIGTGSYLPELWSETYATADIIAYDGQPMVKAGREFLLRKQ